MKTVVIILLAGSSTRFHHTIKKQFYEIEGKPLCFYALKPFFESKLIDEIAIVSNKDYFDYFAELAKDINKKVHFIEGGNTRFNSVDNALNFLKDKLDENDNVLIHDGARLFLEEEEISELINALKISNAATLAIPLEDSIGEVENGELKKVPDRNRYVRIQTPQAFKFKTILKAHKNADPLASDDSQLALDINESVRVIKGSKKLNKVTTIDDIVIVKEIIKNNGRS